MINNIQQLLAWTLAQRKNVIGEDKYLEGRVSAIQDCIALCRQFEEFYHQQATKYTSHPCRIDIDQAYECEHWEAEFYGIYERKGQELEWVCDVETKEEADRIVNILN
jgi:hypothetical protein